MPGFRLSKLTVRRRPNRVNVMSPTAIPKYQVTSVVIAPTHRLRSRAAELPQACAGISIHQPVLLARIFERMPRVARYVNDQAVVEIRPESIAGARLLAEALRESGFRPAASGAAVPRGACTRSRGRP